MSSLTSVWNYLYSRIGRGTLPPVSQEEVMTILGFEFPFDNIKWGAFTGNLTLLRWFHALNRHFGVSGKAFYLWKCSGQGRTIGVDAEGGLDRLKKALRDPCAAVVYHCYNHYMVPLGYEDTPRSQVNAYAPRLAPHEVNTFILVGEVSGPTVMHVCRWSDIVTDLQCESPSRFNIRHPERGVVTREGSKKVGGTLHCLLGFRSAMKLKTTCRSSKLLRKRMRTWTMRLRTPTPKSPLQYRSVRGRHGV